MNPLFQHAFAACLKVWVTAANVMLVAEEFVHSGLVTLSATAAAAVQLRLESTLESEHYTSAVQP